MSALTELRERIDALDGELLKLLNERTTIAQEIGVIKSRESLPIYSPDREMKLLRSLIDRSQGPLRPEAIRAIYREIMSAALAVEKDVAIACVGPIGSSSYQAALAKFGSSVRYTFSAEIAGVFEEVAADRADCGVVPLEDPAHGLVNQTLDALAANEVSVCAEIVPDSSSEDERSRARYLVLGRQPNASSGNDHTMLMLRIEDKPGTLVAALEPFKELGINLNHFASRPAMKGSNDIFFFLEAEGHTKELQLSDLFRELSKKCRAVKVLGSYPKSEAPDTAA
ncbi:MAG: chorismate mutase [Verrucomicrobia bacterium]|nr:chorismate mutase [Verrucomicrobiota bacterium]